MIFRQLQDSESKTYTYILADESSLDAVIIDPVKECIERDIKIIQEMDSKLKYVIDTHLHADHITSAPELKKQFVSQYAVSGQSGVKKADKLLKEGDTLNFGKYQIKVFLTPGHTHGCASYYVNGMVFTGDTLMIRGCGRTDFQEGSSEVLFNSVREKLFTLPDETVVYPAHDYNGRCQSSIGEEKKYNPRLKMSNNYQDFKEIMDNLKLSPPQKIDIAVPANLLGA